MYKIAQFRDTIYILLLEDGEDGVEIVLEKFGVSRGEMKEILDDFMNPTLIQ